MNDVFELTVPAGERRPLVVEVPHAGLQIPDEVRATSIVPNENVWRDADLHVDRLYANAPRHGATLLAAKLSRYVVDLNRAADDVDRATVADHPSPRPNQPRGVVWRITTDGKPTLSAPLTHEGLRERIDHYHAPYHEALTRELERLRSRFGYVVLLAGHSMPSVGRSGHTDPGAVRADVVPGTRGRTSCDPRIIDFADAHFRAAGLSVRHDDPYQGGYTTQFYGRPRERCHAIQIELNRALYMNEATGELKEPEATKLRGVLEGLVEGLATIALG